MDFTYEAQRSRIVFAAGARAKTPDELDRLGIARAMVVTTPSQADVGAEFARLIGGRAGYVYPGAQVHTPTSVTEAALTAVSSVQADGILAVGGGSAIGLSKAIALRTGLPQIIVPTTFSGSEVTPILGEVERGVKLTRRDPKILPQTVIYDPEMVAALPLRVALPSLLNAMAHAMEALYAPDANPVSGLMAEEALRALSRALPRLAAAKTDMAGWSDGAYGAWLAGTCLASVSMGLQHKMAHVLGGTFDLPHAEVHAALLPYTAAFAEKRFPHEMKRVAQALGASSAAACFHALATGAGAQPGLKALGLTHAALVKAADLIIADPYPGMSGIERDDILAILTASLDGRLPDAA